MKAAALVLAAFITLTLATEAIAGGRGFVGARGGGHNRGGFAVARGRQVQRQVIVVRPQPRRVGPVRRFIRRLR